MADLPKVDYKSFTATSGNRVTRTVELEEFPGRQALAQRIVWQYRASPEDIAELEAWVAERMADYGLVANITSGGPCVSMRDPHRREKERRKLEEWKRRKGLPE